MLATNASRTTRTLIVILVLPPEIHPGAGRPGQYRAKDANAHAEAYPSLYTARTPNGSQESAEPRRRAVRLQNRGPTRRGVRNVTWCRRAVHKDGYASA